MLCFITATVEPATTPACSDSEYRVTVNSDRLVNLVDSSGAVPASAFPSVPTEYATYAANVLTSSLQGLDPSTTPTVSVCFDKSSVAALYMVSGLVNKVE